MFVPVPQPLPDDEDDEGWPGLDYYGLKSEQFIVSDNPVIGVLLGSDGDVLLEIYQRDSRFGFGKWVEDR